MERRTISINGSFRESIYTAVKEMIGQRVLLFLIFLVFATLSFDRLTPLGIAGGIPYVIILLACWKTRSSHLSIILATLASFLVIVGFFISPPGINNQTALVNRTFSLIPVWSIAFLLMEVKSKGLKLDEINRKLEEEIKQSEEKVLEAERSNELLYETQKSLFKTMENLVETQQEIEEKQEILELALEAGEAGVWSLDISTNTLTWDDQMFKLFDASTRSFKVTYDEFLNKIHPEDRDRHEQLIDYSIKFNIKFDDHYKLLDKQGDIKVIKSRGAAKYNENKEALKVNGLCIDVTSQKLKEEALRESEQRFHSALEYSPIGIGLLNMEGRWLEVNRALTDMLNYSKAEMLAANFKTITHPDDLSQDLKYVKELVEGKIKTYQMEKRYFKKDRSIIWVQLNVSLIKNSLGQPRYFISQIQEVTERKLAEQKIQEIVNDRTSQLEATNQELEAFSYSVSHDLRSPLRSIHGFSQALLEDYSGHIDETGRDYLKRVSSASIRMGRLIDDLLGLARITRQNVNVTEINLSRMAESVITPLKEDYPDTDFRVEPNLKVKGDHGLIRVVLENLLSNAAKYSKKESLPQVNLRRENSSKKQVFVIQDNGVGFDKTYADKLFGAFQRLHSDKDFEGTGIGLATVRRIIHRHNGEVWAESEVGHGSKFYFTIN